MRCVCLVVSDSQKCALSGLDRAVGFHLLEAAVAHPVSSSPCGLSSECVEHGNLKEKEVEEK